jgi:hypothetical protein
MSKLVAVASVIILVAAMLACHKDPAPDPTVVNDAIDAVNQELPKKVGVDVTLAKASLVNDKLVRFDYESLYPSRVRVPPRATALLRGAMMQFACGDAAARKILDAGVTIDHNVAYTDGNELFDTRADVSVCVIYKD